MRTNCGISRKNPAYSRKGRDIIAAVAAAAGLPFDAIIAPNKTRLIAWTRQRAMAAVREQLPDYSLSSIARTFQRNHKTVLHGIRAHRARERRDCFGHADQGAAP